MDVEGMVFGLTMNKMKTKILPKSKTKEQIKVTKTEIEAVETKPYLRQQLTFVMCLEDPCPKLEIKIL